MCGIVGYIGKNSAEKKLVELLKKIEYRGYDSAGLAVQLNNELKITKTEGKISAIENLIEENNSTTGIAHIRWATHGKPNAINAHPHTSNNKKWAVVHNGIIENFEVMKKELEREHNTEFQTETDTEVVPQMLAVMPDETKNINKLIDVCNRLEGSFALACVNDDEKDHLLLAKRKSPLYIARNEDEVIVASDTICFTNKMTEYYSLEDNEFCDASKEDLVFYDNEHNVINKKPTQIEDYENDLDKQEYPHYMLKEIHEIPNVLRRIVRTYRERNLFSKFNPYMVIHFKKIVLVGCGTAYHACMMGAKYLEKFAHVETRAFVASEFRYTNPMIDSSTLCIFISQSGETADTIVAQELAKEKGAFTVALTNVDYSTLAKKVDLALPVCAGPEIAVASTKAYNAQITIMYMLARHFENILFNKNSDFATEIENFANQIKFPNLEEIKEVATDLSKQKMVFFLGRDMDYVSCEEASLKLKETTYINSNAYPSGELKHGFIALIEDDIYVFVIATEKDLLDKTLNGAHEAYARGAKVVVATQLDLPNEKSSFVHKILHLQKFEEHLMPIASIITFQFLGYFTSIGKNLNPDQPRNLAKSVTVE